MKLDQKNDIGTTDVRAIVLDDGEMFILPSAGACLNQAARQCKSAWFETSLTLPMRSGPSTGYEQ